MSMIKNTKNSGTFEITVALSHVDLPIERMKVDYVCDHCGHLHQLSRGGTPRRTVTIEVSDDGFLVSAEYLHPGSATGSKLLRESPLPPTATCPECRHGSMVPQSFATYC